MALNKQPTSKTVHTLNSPYSDPLWYVVISEPPTSADFWHRPITSATLETTVLDLLTPLLTSIRRYRHQNSKNSRRKRKRNPEENSTKDERGTSALTEASQEPEIQKYLTVGFNSTVRHLEWLSQQQTLPETVKDALITNASQSLYTVLVCTSTLPDVMTAPLPLLVATASLSLQDNVAVRLIPISQSSSMKISEALKQPRVNVLGLLGGHDAIDNIQKLVAAEVGVIDVPWLREAANNRYRPLKVHTAEISVGEDKNKKRKKDHD